MAARADEEAAAPALGHRRGPPPGAGTRRGGLRECLDWLQRLERGEPVAVNLLPELDGGRGALRRAGRRAYLAA